MKTLKNLMFFVQGFSAEPLKVRWNQWTKSSINRNIFGAALVVALIAFLVKVAALVKEVVVAAVFGTSDSLDAFFIAFLLPMFVFNVVARTVYPGLIPTYVQVREQKGHDAAQDLLSGIMLLGIGFLAALTLILAAIGPMVLPYLGSGFGPEKIILTQKLFYYFLPILFIHGLAIIYISVLNAGENFALAAIAPAGIPILSIIAMLLFGEQMGIFALALGTLAGFCLELFILALSLRTKGISLAPKWVGFSPEIMQVIHQCKPMLIGSLLGCGLMIVDQSMAATLPSGSVATLNYGVKVTSVIRELGIMTLGTVVLPFLSKQVANADWSGLTHTIRTYSWLILKISIPITIALLIFSKPIIHIMFERGAFTATDTKMVALVQSMFFLQLPFAVLTILGERIVSAVKENYFLMKLSIATFVLKIVLNFVFMNMMGVAGIALSTTGFYVLSAVVMYFFLSGYLKKVSA